MEGSDSGTEAVSEIICPAQTGPVWKCGGEPCGCTLPADHPLTVDHQCSCGSWWVDSIRKDLQRET